MDVGQSFAEIRKQNPEESLFKVYTFNSSRKAMMTVVQPSPGVYRIYAKGASEIILSRCSYIFGKEGVIESFGPTQVNAVVIGGNKSSLGGGNDEERH